MGGFDWIPLSLDQVTAIVQEVDTVISRCVWRSRAVVFVLIGV